MSSNINELKLYFGDDYPINDYITLHQPKVNDVIEMGEADYYSTVYALTAIPSDMKSQQVPVKDGFDGKNDTGMELVYDDELKRYVLRYVSEGGQQSIFDPEYANVVNGEATIVDEQPALPMNAPLLECSEQDATEADNSTWLS